jgi:hypothetical protein
MKGIGTGGQKMKKAFILLLIVLLIAGGAAWYFTAFKLDGMIRQAIEDAGTDSFGTSVTVGSLVTDLKNGSLTISDITIANPPGYGHENAFTLSGIEAAVDYQSLEIKRVVVNKPEMIVVEKNGQTNFSQILENLEDSESASSGGGEEQPVLVIHHFRMNESRAAFESKSLDHYSDIKVDAVEIRNLEGTPDELAGAIAKEVIGEVVSAAAIELLKAKASEKFNKLLNRD